MLIANWSNPYHSPSDFEVESFGAHDSDYYFDHFAPRAYSTAFERKFPHEDHGLYPPTHQMHHKDAYNEADNYSSSNINDQPANREYLGGLKRIVYRELETPHSVDPVLAKTLDDPNIFYHSYEDFPPDFYKAEYYHGYANIAADLSPNFDPFRASNDYEHIKIHSLAENGFYYYDPHRQTDLREFGVSPREQAGWHGGIFAPDFEVNKVQDKLQGNIGEQMIHSSGQSHDPRQDTYMEEIDPNYVPYHHHEE